MEKGRLAGFGRVTPATGGTTFAISNNSLIAIITCVSHACAAGSLGKTSPTAVAKSAGEMAVPNENVEPEIVDKYPAASRIGSFDGTGRSNNGGAPIAGNCAAVATE